MRVLQSRIANTAPIAIIIGALLLGFYLVKQVSVGNEQWAVVSCVAIGTGLVVLRPRLGLYAILITLLFTDSGSAGYLGGYRLTSPSTMVAAGTIVGLAALVALRRSPVTVSALYVPFAMVSLALWIARFRYDVDLPISYVTTQALLLAFLTHQLIRNGSHLRTFLVMLALVLLARNSLDIGLTLWAILNGEYLGPIRFENLPLSSGGGSSTTGSDLRSLLLPLFIAAAVLAPSRMLRLLFALTLISGIAWVSLSAARGGILGLALGTAFTLVMLPPAKRKNLLLLMSVGFAVVVGLAVYFSDSWTYMMRANEQNLLLGWDSVRPSLWRGAWNAFLENPLFGESFGPAHSYILKGARMMGLVFLVPFLAGLWLLWRRASWLRRQPLGQLGQAVALGVQAAVPVVLIMSTTGNMLGTFVVYYFFILVGLLEAIYQDVRHGRGSFAGQQGSMAVKQQVRAD